VRGDPDRVPRTSSKLKERKAKGGDDSIKSRKKNQFDNTSGVGAASIEEIYLVNDSL
jgi:hypothetical protein